MHSQIGLPLNRCTFGPADVKLLGYIVIHQRYVIIKEQKNEIVDMTELAITFVLENENI